jgi:hypothetical protein
VEGRTAGSQAAHVVLYCRAVAWKGIRVEPIHAIHGNQEFTVLMREPDFIDSVRYNCGYRVFGARKAHSTSGDSVDAGLT